MQPAGSPPAPPPPLAARRPRSPVGGIAPLIVVAVVALAAGGALGYYVRGNVVAPTPSYATVQSITITVSYAAGVPAVLGASPLDGCALENCPVELPFNLLLPYGVGVLNLLLLSTANTSLLANITSVTSVPSGIASITPVPVFLPANQTADVAAFAVTYPKTPVSYTLTVTLEVG